jgi:hypothetical protein
VLMDVFGTAWLWIESHSTDDTERAIVTVDQIPRGTDVLATISLSYLAFGIPFSVPGAVGAAIVSWDVYTRDGTIVQVDPDPDFANNSVFINNCASVTFELAGNDARAYAQATLFTL